jgi:anthranilate phosphoribosyltransferase
MPSDGGQILRELAAVCSKGDRLGGAAYTPAVEALLDPAVPEDGKAQFLRALTERGETAEDLAGFVRAILPHAVDPGVSGSCRGRAILDCCGTGGGGLAIANVSTGTMFLLAAAGVPVVKHGNRGLTKKSGSADVLKALGIRVEGGAGWVQRSLEQVGCAFLFAPEFHPVFKAVAPVRQQLGAEGRRTIFNLLAPLLNPARPEAQVLGVFKREHLALFAGALEALGRARYLVIHGEHADGQPLGEASASGKNRGFGSFAGTPVEWNMEFYDPAALETLRVSGPEESALRLEAVLAGREKGLLAEMLCLNAAVGLWVQGAAADLEAALDLARDALLGGGAAAKLRAWRELSAAA